MQRFTSRHIRIGFLFFVITSVALSVVYFARLAGAQVTNRQEVSEAYYSFNGTSTFIDSSPPTSFTTFEELIVDRRFNASSKDFIVLGSINVTASSTSHEVGARMTIGGAAVTDTGDETNNVLNVSGDDAVGITQTFMATTSLATATTSITLDYKSGSSGHNIGVRDASIAVIEIPEGALQFASTTQRSTSGDSEEIAFQYAFTPTVQQDYLIIGYAELGSTDWDDATGGGTDFRFKVDGVDHYRWHHNAATALLGSTSNNTNRFVPVTTFFLDNFNTTKHTVTWTFKHGDPADDAKIQNVRFVTIPMSGEEYYFHTQTTDYGAASTNQSIIKGIFPTATNTAPHLIAYTTSTAPEDQSSSLPSFHLRIDKNDIEFLDSFNEPTETSLANRAPEIGGSWSEIIDVGGCDLQTDGNGQIDATSGSGCAADNGSLYQTGSTMSTADYEVIVEMVQTDATDDYTIVACRIQDANNMYAFEFTADDSDLYERVSGTWTNLGDGPGVADGSQVILQCEGSEIRVYDDDVEIISVTDTSHSAAGRAGFGMGAVVSSDGDLSGQEVESFEVRPLPAPKKVVRLKGFSNTDLDFDTNSETIIISQIYADEFFKGQKINAIVETNSLLNVETDESIVDEIGILVWQLGKSDITRFKGVRLRSIRLR